MDTTLSISDALQYGIDRLLSRGGAILFGLYAAFQLLAQVSFQSLFAEFLAGTVPAEQIARTYPLAVDVPVVVSAGVTILLVLAGMVLTIVTMRAMHENINRLPTADHLRRLPRTVGVILVVSVITFLAIMIGTVFLIIPGIFLAVSLVFSQLAVALEDAGVMSALQRSWSLTAGHRLRLFVLGFLIAILGGITGGIFGVLGVISPLAGNILSAIVTSLVSLYGLGVLVGAYQQLAVGGGSPPSEAVSEM
ncbi:hypothetical protein LPA44_17220 [Halobacterium sp. KA-4]|uniref:hypothetical protein n=1 Tax=Halobacterium sp. KA-4 TaxID=2896367 RepID=UPI001E332222|nr:hypothetical protein [Halobacterium sp. KA-4]MCD2201605.1 hypothetical protein [Halobacterium sp. KA-4]